ncbi:SpoIIIAC/SpoIIIAD family protein, partial [Bacillus safensis]
AEFATDICRESGYQAIAGQIEIFAKLSILLISMPVLMGFIETLGAFL